MSVPVESSEAMMLRLLLTEQRKTNELLSQLITINSALIEALAEEDQEDSPVPATYMDGTQVR